MNKEDLHDIAQKGKMDAIRLKPNSKMAQFKYMSDVNEPLECIEMLRKLNLAITTLSELSDCNYYLEHIWNGGTFLRENLEKNGFTEDYFMEVEDKLRLLRALLFGDSLDFEELYKDLYDKLLYHEAYWNAYNDDWNQKLHNENQRLKKKISELEKSNK